MIGIQPGKETCSHKDRQGRIKIGKVKQGSQRSHVHQRLIECSHWPHRSHSRDQQDQPQNSEYQRYQRPNSDRSALRTSPPQKLKM